MTMAGAAAIPEEFNKFFPLVAGWWTGTTEIKAATRQALENKVFRQENIPVPLRPEQLPRFHRELNLTFGKEKANEMMKFVDEASYAYWNKSK